MPHYMMLHVSFPGGNPLISNVRTTMAGIEWEAPSNVPMACFGQYIVSDSNSNVELTVSDTMASLEDLREAGFTFCEVISIQVTPVPFNTSSATSEVSLNDGMCLCYLHINIVAKFWN